jgi:hypothetical protein
MLGITESSLRVVRNTPDKRAKHCVLSHLRIIGQCEVNMHHAETIKKLEEPAAGMRALCP